MTAEYVGRRVPAAGAWIDRAACRGEPLSTFYPDVGHVPAAWVRARTICQACPVQPACLAWVLEVERAAPTQTYGFCGGRTARARRRLREGH
jgi:hypothetical protein